MRHWTAIDWLKRLTIILLVFLSVYLLMKLTPLLAPLVRLIITVFTPFLIAALITYLLHPIVEKLHKKGLPRTMAILIIYILFFGLVGYGMFKGTPYIVHQLKDFGEQVPHFIGMYHHHVNDFYYATSDLPEAVHDHFDGMVASIEQSINQMVEKIIEGIKWFFTSFFTIMIIPLLVFYFLKDFEHIKKGIWTLTPKKWRNPGKRLIKEINYSLGNYIRGQLYVCLILAILASLGLWIIKVPYPLLLGIFIGITDIIPYFGPLIGAIPALLLASTVSIKALVFVLLIVGFLQILETNIVGPLIVGKTVDIHPVYIMLSLIIGGEIGGVIGLLLAVPAFVIIRVVITHIHQSSEEN